METLESALLLGRQDPSDKIFMGGVESFLLLKQVLQREKSSEMGRIGSEMYVPHRLILIFMEQYW